MPKGDSLNHERDGRAWSLRLSGATYAEIGAALGVTRQRAEQICKRMLVEHSPSEEDVDEHRKTSIARLDRMTRAVWRQALEGNQGAIDRVLRIEERRARLMGLDGPTKSTVEVVDGADVLARLRAKLGDD